ncbi:RluA family pseudouridine synthase [Chamaesiphon minutus]|uniref:Pseudouridine synthase n=1 Tax=Chamaesiphon minutus (strain ATCC 27169 / PCC 6605) TaxID=1173020 RepID=K9UIH3_CHAP6|nr:RluA family pseudouridine synthase [Chamaesiphon minutus]AFY93999.1 pseudouridine synthase, RluA family [Chamaesiphon minutus PCC 6605]
MNVINTVGVTNLAIEERFSDEEVAEVIELTVATDDLTEPRIDLWLAAQLPDFSRSRWQKLISQGHVRVGDRDCNDKKYKLKSGDRVCVVIPPPDALDLIPEAIPLDILYEDECLLVVNKPAGMVVHPSAGHSTGTLVHALLAHCPLSSIGGIQRPGIVHRLDKDTTGAIAIAKTDFAHQHLQQQLQAKTARREYLGVVYGAPKVDSGTIDLPIGRHPVDRQKNAIVPLDRGGRSAITHWQIEERLRGFTLIRFRLQTGRTHQIRVHAAQMGHPIVGDPVYGTGRSIGINLPGQALHARQLQLIHPHTAELISATAPIPSYFLTLLQVLRKR